MSDLEKLEEAMKKIKEAADKLLSNVSSFNYGYLEAKIHALEILTGMSFDDILAKFAAGWTLYPPEINKYKFDDYILQCQLDDIAKAERDNELRGYYHFGFSNEPLIPKQAIVKLKFEDDVEIDFDEKPEEMSE